MLKTTFERLLLSSYPLDDDDDDNDGIADADDPDDDNDGVADEGIVSR
jgi:hypothetical protein